MTFIIPVFNQEKTIQASVEAAVQAASATGGRVIVGVNACTDGTAEVVRGIRSELLEVVFAPHYCSAYENFRRVLEHVKSPYACLCGGDDLLDPAGQAQIRRVAEESALGQVFVGDHVMIDDDGRALATVNSAFSWRNVTRRRAIWNVLRLKYPNLNGAWIPTAEFIRSVEYAEHSMTSDVVSNAGDLCVWWRLVARCKIRQVGANAVFYRVTNASSPSVQYQRGSHVKGGIAVSQFYRTAKMEFSGTRRLLVNVVGSWQLIGIWLRATYSVGEQMIPLERELSQLNRVMRSVVSVRERSPFVFRVLRKSWVSLTTFDHWLRRMVKSALRGFAR